MARQPRILVLVSSLGGGGAERVATHLCNAWSAAGSQVALLATFPTGSATGYSLDSEVRLLTPTNVAPTLRKTPWSQLRRLLALRSIIRSERPDFVVCFLTNVNVAGIVAATGLGVRVIVCERIYPPRFPLGRTLEVLRRLTYPLAHRVIVQTKASAEWFQQHIPRARATVIPNPLVLPIRDTQPTIPVSDFTATQDKLILAAGRLDAQKGFADLLEAFAKASELAPTWRLVVLGEGPERPLLARKIEALGLTERAHMPGWAGNIGQWYRRADLFVLSSHFEGFPNALLEAMGHGTACVAYDCPTGPAELIEDGRTGLLVDPATGAAGLATAMRQLMDDAAARNAMAAAAHSAAARYAQDHVLSLWAQLLSADS